MGNIANSSVVVFFMVVGVLEIIMGIPLLMAKVKPNRVYGFRISYTWTDHRIWFPVNRLAGREAIIHGAILAIVSGVLGPFISKLNVFFVVVLQLTLLVAPIIFMAVYLTVYAANLKKQRPEAAEHSA